jgi:hypothetical protein
MVNNSSTPGAKFVAGYTRKDGKQVKGYWRQGYGLGLPKTAGTGTAR